MNYSKQELWQRFQKYFTEYPELSLAVDISRMSFAEDYLPGMESRIQDAFRAMADLEKGGLANPDEHRMVGHYWLRAPELAPNPQLRTEILNAHAAIKSFAADVHAGRIHGSKGPFNNLLLIGIGGSALGPQFVAEALGSCDTDMLKPFFLDNTDPDGIDNVLSRLRNSLGVTLCIVVSKSGGTKETRNGMLETKAAYQSAGLEFSSHAVAVTSQDSELDKLAVREKWLARFPMWDWVGGRTSELSAVGLLPAALQGVDIDQLLAGAKACDAVTRRPNTSTNPAAQLALMWFFAGNGIGAKNMVILPYKDRLQLFSKYLQQLVMESLGKRLDLKGKVVHQGLTVFGNKGSTDQHSYIQQLRDGLDNFFVVFVEVLRDRRAASIEVDPGATSGDYLEGFFLGTRQALFESGRQSITLTVREVSAFTVGALIALFERAVGLYASLVSINAYHQPGVEAGKKAASALLELQLKIQDLMAQEKGVAYTVDAISAKLGLNDQSEAVYKICEHLSANPDHKIQKVKSASPALSTYRAEP
jgi:glucose-6-phosphate isomerase